MGRRGRAAHSPKSGPTTPACPRHSMVPCRAAWRTCRPSGPTGASLSCGGLGLGAAGAGAGGRAAIDRETSRSMASSHRAFKKGDTSRRWRQANDFHAIKPGRWRRGSGSGTPGSNLKPARLLSSGLGPVIQDVPRRAGLASTKAAPAAEAGQMQRRVAVVVLPAQRSPPVRVV